MNLSKCWVQVIKPQKETDEPESITLPSTPTKKECEIEVKVEEIVDDNQIVSYSKEIITECNNNKQIYITTPELTCYWEGYSEASINPYPLNKIPETVQYTTIAFVAPVYASQATQKPKPKQILHAKNQLATTWDFDTSFVYSKQQIKQWIAEINQRKTGQKVLFSLLDTPNVHWYPNVDIPIFAKNVADTVKEWNLGGVDIDAESGMDESHYASIFVELITCLRKEMGPNKLIIYTCYTESSFDSEILAQTKDKINILNTMAYWDNLQGMQQLFAHYAQDIGDPSKVGLGVKAGDQSSDPSTTPLDTVKSVAQWLKSCGYKRMMLWSLTRDVQPITHQNDKEWLDTMLQYLS